MQPYIDVPLLPHYHLQDPPHVLPRLIHLLAPEEELDSVGPPLALRLVLAVRVHLEDFLVRDVHGDQAPGQDFDCPLRSLVHLWHYLGRGIGRSFLLDKLSHIGNLYLSVYFLLVRAINLIKLQVPLTLSASLATDSLRLLVTQG